jgi:hypothetical protein
MRPNHPSRFSRVSLVNVLQLLFFAGLVASHLVELTVYPTITCDEALYASQASQLLTRGGLGMDVYEMGDPFYRDLNMVHMGRANALLEAGLFAVTGVSWWASRLFGLIGLVGASLLLFVLGKRLYGKRAAIAAVSIFATSLRALLSGHVSRPDMWGTVFVLLGIVGLFALIAKPRGFWFAAAMGLIAMLAVDAHAYLIGFVIGYCLVVFVQFTIRTRNLRIVFGYSLGVVAGIGLWIVTHFLPYPEQAFYQMTTGYRMLGNLPLTGGVFGNLASFAGWLRLTFWDFGKPLSLAETILTVIGIFFGVRRRDGLTWALLVIVGISMAVFALAFGQRFVQYGIYWSPLLILLGVTGLRDLFEWLRARLSAVRLSATDAVEYATALLVCLNLLGTMWLYSRFVSGEYMPTAQQIADAVPTDSRVIADSTWWWVLNPGRVFSDSDVLVAARGKMLADGLQPTPGEVAQSTLLTYQPDYVVLDRSLSCTSDVSDLWRAWTATIKAECESVASIDGPWVGTPGMEVYQVGQTISVYHCPQP